MNKKIASLLMAASLMAVAGCAKKETPQDLPPPPVGAEGPTGPAEPVGPAAGSQADFIANISSDRIFFDTDNGTVRRFANRDHRIFGSCIMRVI